MNVDPLDATIDELDPSMCSSERSIRRAAREVEIVPRNDDTKSRDHVKVRCAVEPLKQRQAIQSLNTRQADGAGTLKTERTMDLGFYVSQDCRYALSAQWAGYHQDVMLAERRQ